MPRKSSCKRRSFKHLGGKKIPSLKDRENRLRKRRKKALLLLRESIFFLPEIQCSRKGQYIYVRPLLIDWIRSHPSSRARKKKDSPQFWTWQKKSDQKKTFFIRVELFMCFSNFGEFHSCSKRLCYSAMMTLAGRKKKRRRRRRERREGDEKKRFLFSLSLIGRWKVAVFVYRRRRTLPLSLSHTHLFPLSLSAWQTSAVTQERRSEREKEWEMYPK